MPLNGDGVSRRFYRKKPAEAPRSFARARAAPVASCPAPVPGARSQPAATPSVPSAAEAKRHPLDSQSAEPGTPHVAKVESHMSREIPGSWDPSWDPSCLSSRKRTKDGPQNSPQTGAPCLVASNPPNRMQSKHHPTLCSISME